MEFPNLKLAASWDHMFSPITPLTVDKNSKVNEVPNTDSTKKKLAALAIFVFAAIATGFLLPVIWYVTAKIKMNAHNEAVAALAKASIIDSPIESPTTKELKEIKTTKLEAKAANEAQKAAQADAIKEFGLTPEMVGLIYHMTEKFMEVAEMFGANFVANGGTFIGALRHNGMIRWDDDADLQLLLGQELKLSDPVEGTPYYKLKPEVEAALAERGIKMVRHWGGWKLCPIQYPDFGRIYCEGQPGKEFCFPFVDIFISKESTENPGEIVVNTTANTSMSKDKVANWESEHYPNVKQAGGWIQFGPLKMPVAYKTEAESHAWVDRVWGANWKEKAKIVFNHKTGKPADPRREFDLVDYSAPEYSDEYYKKGTAAGPLKAQA